MMQKLLDPGLNYEHIKQDTIDGKSYDVVKISFESENEKPTDIYQVYINQETSLIDQFLFTVVDFGVVETPFFNENGIRKSRKYVDSDYSKIYTSELGRWKKY